MEVVLKFSAVYVVIIHLIGRNLRPKAESRKPKPYFQVGESLFLFSGGGISFLYCQEATTAFGHSLKKAFVR